jgi:hypothetical protein
MDITLALVTLFSLLLAAVMTTLAWRLAREERRRSDARVAALAAAIHGGPHAMPDPRGAASDLPLRVETASAELFASAQPPQGRSRPAAVFALGVLVVGSVAALVVVLSGQHHTAGASGVGGPQTAQAAKTPNVEAAPLELVALTHDRDADRLVVRGIVRNPDAGADVTHLTAVVLLFNHDGGFVASGRAAVDASTLAPGMETPFAVAIAGASDVGHYRVSFRTPAPGDRVVPHVDRRERAMAQAKQP